MQRVHGAMVAVAICSAVIVMCSCSTYTSPRYSSSIENAAVLRSLQGSAVNVGEFTATHPGQELTCRSAGPIKPPNEQPFELFIRDALVAELQSAAIYSPSAASTLEANLDSIDFSSASDPAWDIAMTVSSSNGRTLSVVEHYPFTSNMFDGEIACTRTARAFMPAVQNLIGKLVRSPEFGSLIQ